MSYAGLSCRDPASYLVGEQRALLATLLKSPRLGAPSLTHPVHYPLLGLSSQGDAGSHLLNWPPGLDWQEEPCRACAIEILREVGCPWA